MPLKYLMRLSLMVQVPAKVWCGDLNLPLATPTKIRKASQIVAEEAVVVVVFFKFCNLKSKRFTSFLNLIGGKVKSPWKNLLTFISDLRSSSPRSTFSCLDFEKWIKWMLKVGLKLS